jgi:nitroimidazol reductase NimA-like FMN-containing flavoprotein (pyridoxamine 5'-phosphate oxidase superfamily)
MTEMSAQEIDDLMSEGRIGRLAMASSDGYPYLIPMPFCWVEGTIYLRLSPTGRKGALLKQNNRVCFEIDACSDDMSDYASILIEGRLEPVDNLGEKARVREETARKYERLRRGYRPGHGRKTSLEQLPLCRIKDGLITGRKRSNADQV